MPRDDADGVTAADLLRIRRFVEQGREPEALGTLDELRERLGGDGQ